MQFKTAALAVATVAAVLATTALTLPQSTVAQGSRLPEEPAIRKALGERLKGLPPIDEVSKSPLPGLFEVRIGNDIVYTDANGDYLINGHLIEVKTQRNLTEERVAKLTAIDFGALPLKDAIVWKNGNGKRRIAVFADPNCGFCKRFERELGNVKDVTVYTFMIPILGGDSPEKAKAIWCAKDATAAWRNWMVDGTTPPRLLGDCATPLERNLELSRKHRVNGTPAIVFENGVRVPGMLTADQLEKQLASNRKG